MTTRKKLFFIINRLVVGGHSADTVSLAHHLTDKYDITILYGEKETYEIEMPHFLQNYPRITFIKIPSLHRAILPFKDAVAFKQLYSILKKNRPDIVHTHGFKSGLLGRLAAKAVHVPVIIHTYHGHVFHSYYGSHISRFICFIERKLASISHHIIAISPQQAYELSTKYRIAPANKISTIFIGLDEQNFITNTGATISLRNDYHIPANAVVIAIIGRLVPIKNHNFFVRMAEKILQQNKDVFFFIIGDGEQKSVIKKQFSQHHLPWQEGTGKNEDIHIHFTSWITDIASVLSEIDIVVSTSLNEGTPVSLIEAQWLAKPVVATNVGGVRDTIINNETGFLIDDFDIDDFVKKLTLLIDDKTVRENMGKKGERFVKERFGKKKETDAIDRLYTFYLQNKKEPT